MASQCTKPLCYIRIFCMLIYFVCSEHTTLKNIHCGGGGNRTARYFNFTDCFLIEFAANILPDRMCFTNILTPPLWSPQRDSNPRPTHYKCVALKPLSYAGMVWWVTNCQHGDSSLKRHISTKVGLGGLEPLPEGRDLQSRCRIRTTFNPQVSFIYICCAELFQEEWSSHLRPIIFSY